MRVQAVYQVTIRTRKVGWWVIQEQDPSELARGELELLNTTGEPLKYPCLWATS